jgi:hypothetical protein
LHWHWLLGAGAALALGVWGVCLHIGTTLGASVAGYLKEGGILALGVCDLGLI